MEEARKRLNVLVVDDSAVVRQAILAILSGEPDISVQTASDPLIAEQKMATFSPDVIVLDLEMPRMDGLTFLGKLMTERPLPVVVCSSYAEDGSEMALRALELGGRHPGQASPRCARLPARLGGRACRVGAGGSDGLRDGAAPSGTRPATDWRGARQERGAEAV